MTVCRMRIACWMPKATHTHTHTEYVILIAFLLQQWLHERASLLACGYCRELCSYRAIRTVPCVVFRSLPLLSTKRAIVASGRSRTLSHWHTRCAKSYCRCILVGFSVLKYCAYNAWNLHFVYFKFVVLYFQPVNLLCLGRVPHLPHPCCGPGSAGTVMWILPGRRAEIVDWLLLLSFIVTLWRVTWQHCNKAIICCEKWKVCCLCAVTSWWDCPVGNTAAIWAHWSGHAIWAHARYRSAVSWAQSWRVYSTQ